MRQLRRTLLSDRQRIDPDPHRQSLNLLLCTRQTQLLEHRGSLLTAQASIVSTHRLLETITDPGERELMRNHLSLLENYRSTCTAFVQHLQEEIDQLRAELRG